MSVVLTDFRCPNCAARLVVTGTPKDPSTVVADQELVAAVKALVARWRGEKTFTEIRMAYDAARAERGWPEASSTTLGRALRATGARPWRTRSHRGWSFG